MNYSILLLKTRQDCEAMLNIAKKDKASLEFRKTSLERQLDGAENSSVEIDAELAAVTSELTALESVIASLPNGETKDDNVIRLKKLELRKLQLEDRKDAHGVFFVLAKEYDIGCIDRNLEESTVFIAAITDHMNSL